VVLFNVDFLSYMAHKTSICIKNIDFGIKKAYNLTEKCNFLF